MAAWRACWAAACRCRSITAKRGQRELGNSLSFIKPAATLRRREPYETRHPSSLHGSLQGAKTAPPSRPDPVTAISAAVGPLAVLGWPEAATGGGGASLHAPLSSRTNAMRLTLPAWLAAEGSGGGSSATPQGGQAPSHGGGGSGAPPGAEPHGWEKAQEASRDAGRK